MISQIKSFDYIMRAAHRCQFYVNIDDQVILHKIISYFIS
jgi:hypothetical protein